MPNDRGKDAGRNHENAEFRAFHEVLRPMCLQRFFHVFHGQVFHAWPIAARLRRYRPAFATLARTGFPSSSACETLGARTIRNWTISFENRRSRLQSRATRSFFSNRGNLLR